MLNISNLTKSREPINDKSNIDRELFDTSRGQSCLITPELSREEIVKYRKSLGMTQKQFADEFSIPLGTLRRWEQGQNNPQLTANVARLFTQVVMNK